MLAIANNPIFIRRFLIGWINGSVLILTRIMADRICLTFSLLFPYFLFTPTLLFACFLLAFTLRVRHLLVTMTLLLPGLFDGVNLGKKTHPHPSGATRRVRANSTINLIYYLEEMLILEEGRPSAIAVTEMSPCFLSALIITRHLPCQALR
jgi:hypothetical protein